SKIEAGKMDVGIQTVPVAEINGYIAQHFQPIAEQKGISLDVVVDDGTPGVVSTDPGRLQQILKNLLSNALKFTEHGSVRVRTYRDTHVDRFFARTLRRAPAALAFEVKDTGIGIAPEKQQLIFEAFQQADTSTSRVYGGTGLGLTISRELARLLGGEIHLRSLVGEGSTFTLFLPLSDDDRRLPEGDVGDF